MPSINRLPMVMATSTQIKTRFLILSDTHAALPDPGNHPEFPYSWPFPSADVAIHAGDLTLTGKLEEHQKALNLLKSLPAPLKIVVPGNHDLTLDERYCEDHYTLYGWSRPHTSEDLKAALALYTNIEASEAGIRFLIEGTHTFVLSNGAKLTVYVNSYTPEFCDWAFAYPRSRDVFSAEGDASPESAVPQYNQFKPDSPENPDLSTCVHVIITHGPPKGILDTTTKGENVGCEHLRDALNLCRPLLHCFGHIHEAWGTAKRLWPRCSHNSEIEEPSHRSTGYQVSTTGREGNGLHDSAKNMLEKTLLTRKSQLRRNSSSDRSIGGKDKEQTSGASSQQEAGNVAYIDASSIRHGHETVFINASIMDVNYKPRQKPFIVDLSLPCAS